MNTLLNIGDGLVRVNGAGTLMLDEDKIVLFADGSANFASEQIGIDSHGNLSGQKWVINSDGSASFGGDNGLSIGTDGRIQALQANFCNFGADNSFRINDDGYPRVGNPAVEDFVGIDQDIHIGSTTLKVRRGLVVGVINPNLKHET